MEKSIEMVLHVCAVCRWWTESIEAPNFGVCRRRAPIVHVAGDGGIETAWPATRADTACGDFDLDPNADVDFSRCEASAPAAPRARGARARRPRRA
jgi:DNA primase